MPRSVSHGADAASAIDEFVGRRIDNLDQFFIDERFRREHFPECDSHGVQPTQFLSVEIPP